MAVPKILKRKSTYIVLVLLAGIGGYFAYAHSKSSASQYETTAVVRGDLMQTVEVTGDMKPATEIDLAFKNSGTLGQINVKVGDAVKQGEVLAQLNAADVTFAMKQAQASLAVAQANLAQKQAGSTSQSIEVAQTQVEQSQANYDKAVADLASTQETTQDSLNTAQINLQTAQNNLNNQGAIIGQNVQNAYDSARTQLLTALGPLDTGLSDGDTITAVDNTAANQNFENLLGFLDSSSMPTAKAAYSVAKTAKLAADTAVGGLSSSSTQSDIENAATVLQTAITLEQAYLTDVQKVLTSSITGSQLTPSQLSSMEGMIDADRTSVSAQSSAVLGAQQAITNSGLNQTQTAQQLQDAYKSAQTAYDTAKTNVDVSVRASQTNVNIQKAALDASTANLDLEKSGPRAVDLAPLRASVQQAQVAYDQAVNNLQNVEIIAPVDGTVSNIVPSVGEQIGPNSIVVSMVGTQSYDIEADVPEADITKIEVGQTASTTLDAFGDDVVFSGAVTAKDPAETLVQDAVYYKIHVQIDPAGKEVKPGMTANVTVNTADAKGTLIIPLRAVRTADDGTKTVQTLVNGQPQTVTVTLGLHGDDGLVEVIQGLSEGEQVITGTSS
ncbi:MAG: efflux RND transporter periplasmic adaptor subunit [Patescibacteria group bacterium]